MPRTKTCQVCLGTGEYNGATCPLCSGNGYLNVAQETVSASELDAQLTFMGMPNIPDVDLTDDTPSPGRMANQTWRILEEQRQAAEETIRECTLEIERWSKKLADAERTKRGCEAGQAALDGGA